MFSEIEALLTGVGQSIVMPAHTRLRAGDIEEKSAGEVVTIVDRRAEEVIAARLKELAPETVVIGEEGAFADPRLLDAFYGGAIERCWLVDPLDGTGNFVAGEGRFAIMVALMEKGAASASWIHEPATGRMAVCERGSGAYLNGQRLCATEPSLVKPLCGSILDRFLPPAERQRIDGNLGKITRVPGSKCAGWDYSALAEGSHAFNLYWRLLPWDHAPGALFLTEAGGCVRHFDGTLYQPVSRKSGLIAAVTEAAWERTRDALYRLPADENSQGTSCL